LTRASVVVRLPDANHRFVYCNWRYIAITLSEEFGERTSALRTTSRLHFPYDLPQNAEPELDVAGGEV